MALRALSGWIKRRNNQQGRWHTRFMSISDGTLSFARDEKNQVVVQQIELTESVDARFLNDAPTPSFHIDIPGLESILVKTKTRDDAQQWVAAIHTACAAPSKNDISMQDFKVLSVIGRGTLGKVMLCERRGAETLDLFAIKSVQKKRLVDQGIWEAAMSERDVLMKIRHPFIVGLRFAFQTPAKFYLGLEYESGGDLLYHMSNGRTLNTNDVRLYIAEIGLALEYLHEHGILYRDLKPENVVLDGMGHAKLVDFGLVKYIGDTLTSSFCGTSEYVAPEIYLKIPYSFPVDVWQLGIFSYELFLGRTPFFHENKSQIFSNIVSAEPVFPEELGPVIADFIGKLLTKDAKARPKFSDMKGHAFFEGLDWEKVKMREYRPTFVPPERDPRNPQNFDTVFTSEVPADSYVLDAISDVGNIPGFSYTDMGILP